MQKQVSRRAFLRWSAWMASGAALAGCTAVTAPAAQPGEVAAEGGPEAVSLRYVFVADPGELEIREVAINDFQAAHPDIEIKAELVPEDGMAQKIVTMVAGGAGPDVVYVHPSFVPTFASQAVLAPLEDMAAADPDYQPEDFFQTVVGHFVFDGKTYGYPYYSGPIVTFFNKTLFDQMGEPYPTEYISGFEEGTDEWTWEKAREVAQRTTQGEGADITFGNWPLSANLHWFNHLIWSFGGMVWNEERTECLLAEPAALEAIQYQVDLILTDHSVPLPQQTEGIAGGFSSGRFAMLTSGIKAHVPGIVEAGLEVGMAPVPRGPVARVTRDGPNALGILQSSQVKDAAWQWVRYMTGPKPGDPGGMQHEFTLHRAVPTRQSLYDTPVFVDNLLPWEDLEIYRNASQSVRAFPLPARYAEINSVWREHWDLILTGAMGVEEAMISACDASNPLLTETM